MEAQIFDYTAKGKGNGVRVIVRPHCKYGQAAAGSIVILDEAELQVPSTRRSCMTEDEALEIERELAAKAEKKRQEAKAREQVSVKATIASGLAQLAANAIAMAKKKAADDFNFGQAVQESSDATEDAERAAAKIGAPQGFKKKSKR